MNRKRLLAIGGLLILIVGIIAGLALVLSSEGLNIISKAGPTATPRQVSITNVDSDTFTVSWISDTNVSGFVKYGIDAGKLDQTLSDDRDQIAGSIGQFTTHYITVRGLQPNTTYYFNVGSGSQTYTNTGDVPYQVRTPATLPKPAPDVISGKVLLGNGQPAPGAIVYVNIEGGAPRSAQTKTSGVWTLPLSVTRTADLAQYLTYDPATTQLNILVQAADLGTATAVVTTANDNPVPDITLGEALVAEATPSATLLATPSAELTATGSGVTVGNGFGEIAPTYPDINEAYEATLSVKLATPIDQGEQIATSTPEIKVEGPAGQQVTVTFRSDPQTQTATIDADGEVEFTPPEGLEPGEHTVEIEYIDQNGVLQKISRTFVVLAAEPTTGEGGLPAFTSTPSATLTPSPIGTPSPTATGSGVMPSTESGVPVSGVLTLTLSILMMGLTMFAGGLIWQMKLAKRNIVR